MPEAKKNAPEPCEDWEDQDYDSPSTDPTPCTTSDQLSSSDPVSSTRLPPSSSSPVHSDDPTELENSLMWRNANRNPQYIVLPANAAHSAVTANRPLVPDSVFGKAKVTILKRPKADPKARSTGDSISSSASSSTLSIGLREKAYSEARERIFGSAAATDDHHHLSPSPTTTNSHMRAASTPPHSSIPSPLAAAVAIQRQPNGPVSSDQKGFNSRQKSVSAS
ncbi:hypothetical protein PCANC_26302 [Puccinia coronata f. sp. avenae]|uniref:SUZ domain-containing protein n=1 Tax=Puccinia coronata f. sp. avenae TaxID=200324 RepID=A0A2N5S5D2_9BASI|nr:hypothetical protein PCANC_26302 [Puccinia coronata f. sp. avenae]PLW27140.1 hypothetical protein PCASD_22021 [Puccinia coronata f. sp. avenae]